MRLRLNALGRTNDPRETTAVPALGGLHRKNIRFSQWIEDMNFVARTANEARLLEWWCLCCSADDEGHVPTQGHTDKIRGYERAQLWAHYASNHAGVCLELDAATLHEAIRKAVGKRGEVFERRPVTLLSCIAEVLEKSSMRLAPPLLIFLFQPFTKPLAHQRMRIEGARLRLIYGCKQTHFAEAGNRSIPFAFAQVDNCAGESFDRRLSPQRVEAIAACGAVKQTDHSKDREQHRLSL